MRQSPRSTQSVILKKKDNPCYHVSNPVKRRYLHPLDLIIHLSHISEIQIIMPRTRLEGNLKDRIVTRLKSLFREKIISSNSVAPYPDFVIPDYTLSPLTENDRTAVIDLFNYYIETSFAAYPEHPVSYKYFDLMMTKARGYPSIAIRDSEGSLVGFSMLHFLYPLSVFAHTAEITTFLRPQDTGKGLGSQILQFLEDEGKKRGISCLLISISSRNEGSIRQARMNGFIECGRFRDVGKKKGVLFDMVWMEKMI
jgi:L-amino acid N-acyltransferase YncA